jgi:hypothetical protein
MRHATRTRRSLLFAAIDRDTHVGDAPLDQLANRGHADLALSQRELRLFQLGPGLNRDTALLFDRLGQAFHESPVAVDQFHPAVRAELMGPALLVLATVGDQLLQLHGRGPLRNGSPLAVGGQFVAFAFGLPEQGHHGLQ